MPRQAVSGCPTRTQAARTATRRAQPPTEKSGDSASSIAKSAHGHRQKTPESVINSSGVIVIENAKAIAATSAETAETPSSRSHNQVPARARKSLAAMSKVNAGANGSTAIARVKGENAPDWPLAASGDPQPFHAFRKGSDPSLQAIRTALAHGANCVTTSFKSAFCDGSEPAALQGAKSRTCSIGSAVRPPANPGRQKRTGRPTSVAATNRGIDRFSSRIPIKTTDTTPA
jgi:hypothetical protein